MFLRNARVTPAPHIQRKYEQKSGQHITQNASKQGKLDSFGAIFLLIFLPCTWGLGFQNNSLVCSRLDGQSRSLGNGVRKNGVRNRCPHRRCRVNTEIPYRLFSLILCSGESLEAEFTRWFGGIEAIDTEFPYRVPIIDRGLEAQQ